MGIWDSVETCRLPRREAFEQEEVAGRVGWLLVRLLERRFWRLVMFTLTLDQRYELKSLLPQANQQPPNALGHLLLLEGLTPRQSTRLNALHKEYESEIAADAAAQRCSKAHARLFGGRPQGVDKVTTYSERSDAMAQVAQHRRRILRLVHGRLPK